MSNDQRQTKATLAATYWCAKCKRETLHNVHNGRKAGCQKCIGDVTKIHATQEQQEQPKQEKLFN